MGRKKKYHTEEERKEAQRKSNRRSYYKHKKVLAEYKKQYYQDNKEKILEHQKQYYQENKEEKAEYQKQYNKTPMGRASYLLCGYQQKDKKYDRGECTLTAKWIIDNIFPKPCHWCGETGWAKIGCDRIDNTLPHTPDNVIPCCERCNNKRGRKTYEEFENALRAEETTL